MSLSYKHFLEHRLKATLFDILKVDTQVHLILSLQGATLLSEHRARSTDTGGGLPLVPVTTGIFYTSVSLYAEWI